MLSSRSAAQDVISSRQTFGFTRPAGSASFLNSSQSGRGISMPSVKRPYVMPPKRAMGRRIYFSQYSTQSGDHLQLTAGSIKFRSSLIESSRAQNLTPSMTASTPVFFPGVALLSNSCVFMSLPSTLKIASLTLLALTSLQGAGVRPVSAHSDTP